jgi:hypothetical protein
MNFPACCFLFLLDKRPFVKLSESHFKFLLGIHDDWTAPGDRLVELLAGNKYVMDIFNRLYCDDSGFREQDQLRLFQFRVIKLACSFDKITKASVSFFSRVR